MGKRRSNARKANKKNKQHVTPPTPDTPEPKPQPQENVGVVYAPGGAKYMVVDVAGYGLCGLLAPMALDMSRNNIPVEDIVSHVKTNVTDETKARTRDLRWEAVLRSRDFVFLDDMPGYAMTPDGEKHDQFDNIVHNPMHVIMTRAMWERVVLCPSGLLDGKAVMCVGKALNLPGLRIVKLTDNRLVPVDAGGDLPVEHCPMVLHDGFGHFKALLPVSGEDDEEQDKDDKKLDEGDEEPDEDDKKLDEGDDKSDEDDEEPDEDDKKLDEGDEESGASDNTDKESEASSDIDGKLSASSGSTDAKSEASSDIDGKLSASSGSTDAKSEASVGTNGDRSNDTPKQRRDWSDDEFFDNDDNTWWLVATAVLSDGWTEVYRGPVYRGTRSTPVSSQVIHVLVWQYRGIRARIVRNKTLLYSQK